MTIASSFPLALDVLLADGYCPGPSVGLKALGAGGPVRLPAGYPPALYARPFISSCTSSLPKSCRLAVGNTLFMVLKRPVRLVAVAPGEARAGVQDRSRVADQWASAETADVCWRATEYWGRHGWAIGSNRRMKMKMRANGERAIESSSNCGIRPREQQPA